MNKITASLLAIVACCLFSAGYLSFGALPKASAQRTIRTPVVRHAAADDDAAMAAEIESRTRREVGILGQRYEANGVLLDLAGGFENMALARNEPDGNVTAACVTSLGEANSFFGRNLKTGERVPRTPAPQRPTAKAAADHGMSEAEFVFYSKMIEDAAQHRLASPSASSIVIVNNDGAGEGFNDTTAAFANPEGGNTGSTRGAQRLNVFNQAAAIWGSFLDTNVPVIVRSQFDPQTCSTGGAVLGSAGAYTGVRDFPGAQVAGTWHHIALANKQAGFDLFPADPDINATFNISIDSGCLQAGHRWYYGLDNATPAFRTNLLVVLLHEMGHGLGFATFADGSTGALAGGLPDVWSRFMYDQNTGLHWDAMTDAQRFNSARSNGALKWDGPNVVIGSAYLTAARDTAGRVQLYAPAGYSPGSSVSHFTTAASPDLLMEPNINAGLPIDGDLTRQLLRDIGWFRDATGDAAADTITNVTPSSGIAVVGTTRTITWTNNGGFNRNVRIELSTDGGTTYPTIIASDVANTGSYSWMVPNSPTAAARVRVREADFADPSGVSGSNFVISTAPLAGGASVSGRVIDRTGRGVARAAITLTDQNGASRTVTTTTFGYFTFTDVRVGETYLAEVRHKRFIFEPRTVNLTDNLAGLDFVAAF